MLELPRFTDALRPFARRSSVNLQLAVRISITSIAWLKFVDYKAALVSNEQLWKILLL